MGIIKLTNIRTFSFHGCLEEEAKIGSNYSVNLTIKTNLEPSSKTDELTDTVDYVDLNRIVVEEMAIRAKLLEYVAKRIMDRVLKELQMVTKIEVEVTKLNPPIGGDVEGVTIIMKKKR